MRKKAMPTIYRAMLRDGNHPRVGPSAKALGVRIPGDVQEQGGMIAPGTGGLSVAPGWRHLPMYRVPRRLMPLDPRAAGSNDFECWKLGAGPFESGPVAEGLTHRVDHSYHGLVEPETPMTAENYQALLGATRESWTIEEETKA